MPVKPTTVPTWATNAGTTIDPGSSAKATGWIVGQAPPAKWFNWLLNWLCQWTAFLNDPVATGSGSAIDASSSTTSGSAGLAARAGSGVGIGLVALGAGMAATEASLRSTYNGTAFMAAATGVANTGFIIADGGAWGLVIKGESATLTDVLTAKSRTTHVTALTAAVGDSVAAMLQNNSATDAAVWGYNQAGGPGVRGDSSGVSAGVKGVSAAGPGVTGSSTAGPGGSFTGNATRGAVNLATQSAPSAPSAGDVWADSVERSLCYHDGVAARRIGRVIARSRGAAAQTVTTASATLLAAGQGTIPAGSIKLDDQIIRVSSDLYIFRPSSTSLSLGIAVNGNTSTFGNVLNPDVTFGALHVEFELVAGAIGTSGNFDYFARVMTDSSLGAPALSYVATAPGIAVNTTLAMVVALVVQFGTAHASSSVQVLRSSVEII